MHCAPMSKKLDVQEEKKEGIGNKGEVDSELVEDGSGSDSDSDIELEELSPEILELLGGDRRYKSDDEFREALDKAGLGDLRIVLVKGRPYKVMPSGQHNQFTTRHAADFNRWAWKFSGTWGVCSATSKIFLSNGYSRDPDLSFWGYPRCDPSCAEPIVENSIPDVVIQFSWKNKMYYEENALDDMMTLGLEEEKGSLSARRPNVGYLIKVRFSKKRKLAGARKGDKTQDMAGLDIYRLVHGTTLANARDPNNNDATFMQYTPGGQDVLIVIKPEDLGITGFSSLLCGNYTLKASEIFARMDFLHKNRQARGLAT